MGLAPIRFGSPAAGFAGDDSYSSPRVSVAERALCFAWPGLRRTPWVRLSPSGSEVRPQGRQAFGVFRPGRCRSVASIPRVRGRTNPSPGVGHHALISSAPHDGRARAGLGRVARRIRPGPEVGREAPRCGSGPGPEGRGARGASRPAGRPGPSRHAVDAEAGADRAPHPAGPAPTSTTPRSTPMLGPIIRSGTKRTVAGT